LLARDQIDGSVLAATINFDFEFEPVAFVKASHAGAFDRRNVDERIRLSVIALDEAEPLHCVEEFDGPARLFAGQCPLGRATETAAAFARGITITRGTTVGHGHRLAIDLEIGRRNFAAAIHEREAEWLTLCESGQAGLLDGRNMHEHIFAAIVTNDKAKSFLSVEEFYNARAFANDLRGHATTGTAATTAAKTAAATAAAETTTATATESVTATAAKAIAAATATATAEPVTAAAGKAAAITTAAAAAAAFVTETVAFITSASAAITAATFIETHAVPVLSSKSPACLIQETSCTGRGQNASRRNVIMRHPSRDSRNPPMLRAKIV
jgi:hypothetical protein